MKNNEILLNFQFKANKNGLVFNREMSFLVIKDITLRDLIEGVYYGLRKKKMLSDALLSTSEEINQNVNTSADKSAKNSKLSEYKKKIDELNWESLQGSDEEKRKEIDRRYFDYEYEKDADEDECMKKPDDANQNYGFFKHYLKTHSQLIIQNRSKNTSGILKDSLSVIDILNTVTIDNESRLIYDCTLEELGIVTSTNFLISEDSSVRTSFLFNTNNQKASYVIKENDYLEYNISTRNVNEVELSEINILPAGARPKVESLITVIGNSLMSVSTLLLGIGVRVFTSSKSNGNLMLATSAMGAVSMATMALNAGRQYIRSKSAARDWKENYERYIIRTLKNIMKHQDGDIIYLKKSYPSVKILFQNVDRITRDIFSRSQNDNDFMKISLGVSAYIEPLFRIKSEKKDEIIQNVYYKLEWIENDCCFDFKLICSDDKKQKKKKRKKAVTEGSSKDSIAEEKYPLLSDLAYNLANNSPVVKFDNNIDYSNKIGFKYLQSSKKVNGEYVYPPFLFELRNCGALGIISGDNDKSKNFIRHIVFDLAYYHSPEDIQFVFFFNKTDNIQEQRELIENYKFLPHTNELLDGLSQFVFSKESAGDVFSRLFSIMNERMNTAKSSDNKEESELNPNVSFTQIVCIVFYDYDIKESGFSRFLPVPPKQGEAYRNELGLTFIFLQDDKGKLPKYCDSTISFTDNDGTVTSRLNVLSREQLKEISENKLVDNNIDLNELIEKRKFKEKYLFSDELKPSFRKAYRQLSAIYYKRIAENGKVPSLVTLFEIWGINMDMVSKNKVAGEIIIKNWCTSDITKGLNVPIGMNEHGITYLDMHQNGDGPHGLVAGTTGSGKSETLITYIIGCCMKFSPDDLNFLLVDMKGGGFSDRLGDLPHCIGAVTNTTGESEGISAEYMLRRFLEILNAEIKKRELILSELETDNIDSYIKLRCKIISMKKDLAEGKKTQKDIEDAFGKKKKCLEACRLDAEDPKKLPHLLLIVDEFTELKRFSNDSNGIDFVKDITTIARVGRTLGFHIILVSQNIEGAITDDIRVNSKARICLKVATKSASKDMIGTGDAAAANMPGNGRAYILVGTGSRYEYFQSAYTAANKNMDIKAAVKIQCVPDNGHADSGFYDSSSDNLRIQAENGNINDDDTQLNYICEQIKSIVNVKDGKYKYADKLFRPPLPFKEKDVKDKTNWEGLNNKNE